LVEQDAALVTHFAHRIKGASRMIGAQAFANACEALEQAGRNADWPAILEAQVAFNRAFELLERVLP
jgi:HPt (histidine-containing phosphotransfer) domain-containing protein